MTVPWQAAGVAEGASESTAVQFQKLSSTPLAAFGQAPMMDKLNMEIKMTLNATQSVGASTDHTVWVTAVAFFGGVAYDTLSYSNRD